MAVAAVDELTVVVSTPSANSGALAATRYIEAPSAGLAALKETADAENVP
jgi:hypothetical protein